MSFSRVAFWTRFGWIWGPKWLPNGSVLESFWLQNRSPELTQTKHKKRPNESAQNLERSSNVQHLKRYGMGRPAKVIFLNRYGLERPEKGDLFVTNVLHSVNSISRSSTPYRFHVANPMCFTVSAFCVFRDALRHIDFLLILGPNRGDK